ncbi:MAG: hypothetical protein R2867_13980 [Caldilineaceae bacterium]
MLHQSIDFDWQIGEEWTWESSVPIAAPEERAFTETKLAMILLRGIILSVVALCSAGSLPLSKDQMARLYAEQGVRFALTQERLLRDAGPHTDYGALVDSTIPPQWRSSWRTAWATGLRQEEALQVTLLGVEALGNLAVANVLIENPAPEWGDPRHYREKRYYRTRGQQWLRTVPPTTFWGEVQRLETAHFRFEYYEPDAAVIRTVAPQLEQLYIALYQRLGSTPPARRKKKFMPLCQR